MDLRRSFARFANLELKSWDRVLEEYVQTGIFGSLQVYDRFISDRDFGQKKRIFLMPGELTIARERLLLKVGDAAAIWMLESVNYDVDLTGTYASAVVLREARHQVRLYRNTGGKRASGVGRTEKIKELVETTYGDFSRYSSSESRELDNIDYTIGSWYLPRGTPVDLDTILEDDLGQRFIVREVSSFLDLLMVRVQEQENVT